MAPHSRHHNSERAVATTVQQAIGNPRRERTGRHPHPASAFAPPSTSRTKRPWKRDCDGADAVQPTGLDDEPVGAVAGDRADLSDCYVGQRRPGSDQLNHVRVVHGCAGPALLGSAAWPAASRALTSGQLCGASTGPTAWKAELARLPR